VLDAVGAAGVADGYGPNDVRHGCRHRPRVRDSPLDNRPSPPLLFLDRRVDPLQAFQVGGYGGALPGRLARRWRDGRSRARPAEMADTEPQQHSHADQGDQQAKLVSSGDHRG